MPSAVTDEAPRTSETGSARVRSFRTKNGRCLVDDTYLHVESSYWGYYRNLYEDYWSSGWFGKSVVVGGAIPPLYAAWLLFRLARGGSAEMEVLSFTGLLGVLFLFGLYRRVVRGYTSAARIPLSDVRVVRSERGTKGLTRPRLLVEYDADGATRRRYLLLASLYTPVGEDRFEEAQRILADAGLRVE